MKMNSNWSKVLNTGFLALAATACTQVDPAPDFDQAQSMIEASTGETQIFNPLQPALSEEELDAILDDGLALEEALRLALTNQRDLQASFQVIGIAHADWVQSQLLSNPSLNMLFRFSQGAGNDILEATAGMELLELWRISLRTESASANLDATILQIARQAGEHLATARQTYYAAVAAQELLSVAKENVVLARSLADAVMILQSAGTADALDQSLAQGPLLAAELSVRTARIEAANAKRALALALSLDRAVEGLELTSALPDYVPLVSSAQYFVDMAWSERLDLRAMGKTLDALALEVGLQQRKAWGDSGLGVSYESAAGNQGAILGPALNLELPLFDQNQAQVARAQFQWERMKKIEESAMVAVAQEVRSQLDRVQTSARDLEFYKQEVLPQAELSLRLATESYSAGRISLQALVEVQRQLLQVRRGHVTLRLESANSFAALELAVGLPLATASLKE